jgi:periplasmic divalent cation tolerance protein
MAIALVAHCSCPDAETAARIARVLVEERLAACVQALPGVVSTYRWQGAVQQESEVLLLIKTTRERFDALKARLPDLHPYETPELIALDAVDGLAAYLDWIAAATSRQ